MNLNSTSKSSFQDYKINIKIKLSILWISVTLMYLYGDYFELYVPQKTQGLVNGENLLNSPLNLFYAAVLLAIPAFMVIISLLAKPALNRILNIFFGLFFTALMLSLAFNSFEPWRAFYAFYAMLESIITGIIACLAFKWPKKANESITTFPQ